MNYFLESTTLVCALLRVYISFHNSDSDSRISRKQQINASSGLSIYGSKRCKTQIAQTLRSESGRFAFYLVECAASKEKSGLEQTQSERRIDWESCANTQPKCNHCAKQEYRSCDRAAERILELVHVLDERNQDESQRNSSHRCNTQELVR